MSENLISSTRNQKKVFYFLWKNSSVKIVENDLQNIFFYWQKIINKSKNFRYDGGGVRG